MMITEILLSIFAIATVCFMVGGGILAYSYEKKAWNNGTCQETGQKWKYFDTDSQGGRGYKSGECVVWVSYPGID